jgi:hypothetical protein
MGHTVLERRKVGLGKILLAHNGIEGVPRFIFVTFEGVRGCMLAGGRGLRTGRREKPEFL